MIRIKNLKIKLLCTVTFGMFVGVLYLLKVPCIFLNISNLQCPGCGMTRAWLSLLHGDCASAFSLHPMFWSTPLVYLYILFDGKLFGKKWLDNGLLIFIGIGFLVAWVWKLIC